MSIILRKPFEFGDLGQFLGDHFFTSFPRLAIDHAINLYEEKGNIIAKMNMPGTGADNVDVTINENSLTISGTHSEEEETDEKEYYSKEIRTGAFSRSVRLPCSIDTKKTTADYRDGVLTITAPVAEGEKAQGVKIEVKKVH